MLILILHCISIFIAVCVLILDIGFLDSIIILAYITYILITRSDFLTCILHRLYGWDGTNSTYSLLLSVFLLVYLYACLLSTVRLSLFSAQVAWSLNCVSLYVYIYISISAYTIIHICIYTFFWYLLPPVIYVSAIFHAARWRVHKPRSAVASTAYLATDVTFVNVTFYTMVLSTFEKLSLTCLIKKKQCSHKVVKIIAA